ncbi:hypothetical protein WJX81_000512 [Elliptochloris bilobata]|uniref:INTS8 TPR repeats domain-containing protein n=1 Tax=Elliptochloris bilobata TaxID=381761 RepID=A0AAW1SBV3_9CHLO
MLDLPSDASKTPAPEEQAAACRRGVEALFGCLGAVPPPPPPPPLAPVAAATGGALARAQVFDSAPSLLTANADLAPRLTPGLAVIQVRLHGKSPAAHALAGRGLADMAWERQEFLAALRLYVQAAVLGEVGSAVGARPLLPPVVVHRMCDCLVSLAMPLPAAALLQLHHPLDHSGMVRLLQPPAPGHALAIPLQLHWAECMWELPLLEVLVHLAARHAWPGPVQVHAWIAFRKLYRTLSVT